MVNAENGLREVRLRRYDCAFLAGDQDPSDCTQNEEIKREPIITNPTSTPVSTSKENLKVNELTPWLNIKARTVVNPSVMYNSLKLEMYVILYLRLAENNTSEFKDYKYEFVGDLKSYKDDYQKTRQRTYLKLKRTSSESSEIVNAIVHCYDIPDCQDITLVASFANVNAKGESFIDSRPFMIDQRESEITLENTLPNKTTLSVMEPIIKEVIEDDQTGLHQDTYTPDEGDDPEALKIGAPLLRPENMDSLCEGLVPKGTPCPKYLLDPTLERPKAATSKDVVPEIEVVQLESDEPQQVGQQPQINEGVIQTDDGLEEQSPQATTSRIKPKARPEGLSNNPPTSKRPKARPPEFEKQNPSSRRPKARPPELIKESKPTKRPKSRPPGLVVTMIPEEPVELVDVINEEVFPPEEVILVPESPRQSEPNLDVLPNPNAKNYDTSDYHQFIIRLQAQKVNPPTPQTNPPITDSSTPTAPNAHTETLAPTTAQNVKPPTRPRKRPDDLKGPEEEKEEQKTVESQAVVPFESIDGQFTYDLSLCGTHIIRAKNLNYNQARGHYNSGRLKNATNYKDSVHETIFHSPDHTSRQFGSDVTKHVLEFVGCVLKQRYGENLMNQINSLSYKNGGQLGEHASHQNGLDVDVSYPHINNSTRGFDNFAANLNSSRVVAAFDQARLLVYTDRVQVLFTDNRIRKRFCKYLKDNNKLQSHREIVERFMRNWAGHHDHYHVRVMCTLQNEGCVPENYYPKTNFCK